jgi:glycerol kinase
MLFNLHNLHWDIDIINRIGLQELNYRNFNHRPLFLAAQILMDCYRTGDITAMIGDSHAAAFGEDV